MKKLAIFIVLLIFSISAFAQNESLFTENFTLIRHSGATERIFFEPEVSFPVLGVATAGNRMQSWENLYNLRYRQQENIISEREPNLWLKVT